MRRFCDALGNFGGLPISIRFPRFTPRLFDPAPHDLGDLALGRADRDEGSALVLVEQAGVPRQGVLVVTAQGGLVVTFEAEGPRADRLGRNLAGKPGVEMVAPFGAALHVSGADRRALEQAIAPFRRDPYRWSEVPPTLEDVFAHAVGEQ